MKKIVFSVFFLLVLSVLFSSCEKDGNGGKSYLEGDYVLYKVEVKHTNEKVPDYTFMFDEENDKYVFTMGEGIVNEEGTITYLKENRLYPTDIPVDYEYIFSKDGTYTYRETLHKKMKDGGEYKVKDGELAFRGLGLDFFIYKIVSNNGNTLVFDVDRDWLDLFCASKKVGTMKSCRATYKKK